MAVFTPKRQWKPKRRDRNLLRRKKRKGWWRRNKNRLKIDRKRRYRQLKNNSLFKQWRKKRQEQKQKRRMRFATGEMPVLPESWFIFRDDIGTPYPVDIDMGYIVDFDPDTEQLLIFDTEDNVEKTVQLDDFLRYSEFLENADWDNFELMMEQFYGEPVDDLDIIPESEEAPSMAEELRSIERVAHNYLLKTAFNKENPPDLLSQLVKVLDKASRKADGNARKRLRDTSSRVKGLMREIQNAWDRRDEE